MPEKMMFLQLKTGYDLDRGPCWIAQVRFSKTWRTAYFGERRLQRWNGVYGNFVDLRTGDEWWISGPKRDRTDARYSSRQPIVEDDVRAEYEAFLA